MELMAKIRVELLRSQTGRVLGTVSYPKSVVRIISSIILANNFITELKEVN
jgi:hypothetical protein